MQDLGLVMVACSCSCQGVTRRCKQSCSQGQRAGLNIWDLDVESLGPEAVNGLLPLNAVKQGPVRALVETDGGIVADESPDDAADKVWEDIFFVEQSADKDENFEELPCAPEARDG